MRLHPLTDNEFFKRFIVSYEANGFDEPGLRKIDKIDVLRDRKRIVGTYSTASGRYKEREHVDCLEDAELMIHQEGFPCSSTMAFFFLPWIFDDDPVDDWLGWQDCWDFEHQLSE
jgi:hypothetical protein